MVIGPEHALYVVDHHHWVRAWHDLGLTACARDRPRRYQLPWRA
ncbi:ParB-like protein [Cupriavidus basilensis]